MGPTLTHGMMPLGRKVKVVGLSGSEILSTNYKVTCGKVRDKRGASSPLLGRNVQREKRVLVFQKWWIFSERVSNFSLGFRPIEPSDHFEPRSKVASHDKGYAWA